MFNKIAAQMSYTRAELAALTRAAYFAQEDTETPHVSLLANINGGQFRAVGQEWRPMASVSKYQAEIDRQTPRYARY